MQIPSRFTIAVHILTLIAQNKGNETKLTSDLMAGSVGVNPVIIRKTLSQLKKADLISVQRGTGGATLSNHQRRLTFYRFTMLLIVSDQAVNFLASMNILIHPVQ